MIGSPRLHLRVTDSTNARARELAARGAPSGTTVTAREQSAGRGRHGRTWVAPPGKAVLCSVLIREPPRLLPLAAGVATAEVVGPPAKLKWPNDVLLRGRKVAGILVEGRPQEQWAVVGIGLNVAVRLEDFPPGLRQTAGSMGLEADAVEPVLKRLLESLDRWIGADPAAVLEGVRARDALLGMPVRWDGGEGEAAGVDDGGGLIVSTAGGRVTLEAGEVHLGGGQPS